jgi:hypothetical protein
MIPIWLILVADLHAILVIYTQKNCQRVYIRTFALTFVLQFFLYLLFLLEPLNIETRQNMARLNNIFTALSISTILLTSRFGKVKDN